MSPEASRDLKYDGQCLPGFCGPDALAESPAEPENRSGKAAEESGELKWEGPWPPGPLSHI